MAGSSLLVLIDDIATLLDDISVMTKVAAQKTAGVLGDDLALNAQQVTGVNADRELPVVWAVAVGSLRNKAILVPAALAISAFIPWAHHAIEQVGAMGGVVGALAPSVLNGLAGVLAGALVLAVVSGAGKVWQGIKGKS